MEMGEGEEMEVARHADDFGAKKFGKANFGGKTAILHFDTQ